MARVTQQKSISIEPATLRRGQKRAKQRGFKNSFSAYISRLIVEDAKELNGKNAPGRT